MRITQAIIKEMEAQGVTNAEMARRCEVTPQTMCGRLHEKRAMSLDVIMDTLAALDLGLAVVPLGAKLPSYATAIDEHSVPYATRGNR